MHGDGAARLGPRARRFATVMLGAAVLMSCGTVPPGPVTRSATAPESVAPESAAPESAAPESAAPESAAPASQRPGSPGPGGNGTCDYQPSGEPAKPVSPPPTNDVAVSGTVAYRLKMTNGDVIITMDRSKAPCTVNSFESLADQGYFNQTRCHRLADSGIFILQCGDPTGSGRGGPGYQFASETDGTENYVSGVVAMANAGPNTNGSQFFLIWGDSTSLNQSPNYTIFGRIDQDSRDVVASMAGEGQDGSGGDGTGKPNNPSEIISAART